MLLEREHELELLKGLLDDVGSSGGKVVLIRGEAGIGKTALVREFAVRSSERAHVLLGSCDDLLTPRPLCPFWDMSRQEPSLLQPLEEEDRPGVMDTALGLVSRGLRPTIAAIEDTQWADEATLDVVNFIGRRMWESNGLLILTYRDTEVDHEHPLRNVLGQLAPELVVRIRLTGLSVAAVSELVGDLGIGPKVYEATDGNPFLAIEMASAGRDIVPLSVQDSVGARLDKLSPGTREMVKLFSVMPDPVSLEEMRAIAGDAQEKIREGEERGFLHVDDGFLVFCHDLIRRAVEASLTGSERIASNLLVLETLPLDTDPARLVHHAREAHARERLVEEAPEAARAALAVGSMREAVEHFRQLVPHLEHVPQASRGPLLEDWARAELLGYGSSSPNVPNTLALEHYRKIGDARGESRAVANEALYAEWRGQRREAERLALEAIEVLGTTPDRADLVKALDTNAYLAMMASDSAATIEWANRALEAAGPEVEEPVLIRCLVHKGTAADIAHYPDGKDALDDARRQAEAAGLWSEVYRALINHADPAIYNRDLSTAGDYAQRAIAMTLKHEQAGAALYSEASYARVLDLKGDWDQAEELARDVLERAFSPVIRMVVLPVLGSIETRRGRTSARETVRDAWEKAVASAEVQRMSPAAAALAEYAWITGDTDVPVSGMMEVMRNAVEVGWAWEAGLVALWLWRLGELDETPEGIAEPYRLIMEGDPRRAAELLDERGIPYERAIALSHGDPDARLEALEILEDLGATAVADKLRRELRDEGVSLRRRRGPRVGPGLTARQSEVLDLLADGLSNMEIADRLFLSPRTVEHHVAALMSKLDASTRTEAVLKAVDQGLLASS